MPSNKRPRIVGKSRGRRRDGQPSSKRLKGNGGSLNRKPKTGPRYPAALQKELNLPRHSKSEDEDQQENELNVGDVYEYEDGVPEEESGKNRRFDVVDRLEYELPPDFEDEEIPEESAFGEDDDGEVPQRNPKRLKVKGAHLVDLNSDDEDSDNEAKDEGVDEDDLDKEEGESGYDDEKNEKDERLSFADDLDMDEGNEDDAGEEEDDEERQLDLISDFTGDDASYILGQRKRKRRGGVSEAHEELEMYLNPSTGSGSQSLAGEDFVSAMEGKPRFAALRKRTEQLNRSSARLQAPLRKVIQDRVERMAAYENTKEDISKWQPLVKANREAPCRVFNKNPELPAMSTTSVAAKFQPRNQLEKDIANLLKESGSTHGSTVQAAEALALNKFTVEEVKERQEKLSRMRSLLFKHELAAKRIKKIKSKTFHRLLLKGQKKKEANAEAALTEADLEARKEAVMKQEFKRAQERMTLKHKNTSRWAKRILKRGLQAHADDGVRDAIAEQLRNHALLTKKIHSASLSSSDDDSSSEDEEDCSKADNKSGEKSRAKVLAKAKVATLKALEGDEEAEIPTSGLFALPFMARAIEKKRKEAREAAVAALKQLDSAENDDSFVENDTEDAGKEGEKSGRLSFGRPELLRKRAKDEEHDMLVDRGSDSDEEDSDEDEGKSGLAVKQASCRDEGTSAQSTRWERAQPALMNGKSDHKTVAIGPTDVGTSTQSKPLAEKTSLGSTPPPVDSESEHSRTGHARLFSTNGSAKKHDLKPKDQGMMKDSDRNGQAASLQPPEVFFATSQRQELKVHPDSDEIESVDTGARPSAPTEPSQMAFLSDDEEDPDDEGATNGPTAKGFESQQELIKRAFAGDDVEEEFQEEKAKAVDGELPSAEGPVSLPGWGQWTEVQQRQGLPSWILKERADLQAKKQSLMKARKDARLKHVIISEKTDKKARKFSAQSLPFPFKSKEVYERSIRDPIGPDFNTDKAFRNLIAPKEVKSAGVPIEPIQYTMPPAKAAKSIQTTSKSVSVKVVRANSGQSKAVKAKSRKARS